ncbi:chitobiase/beta-hexosaminidase C-terminal domain-containing protein [Algoriphagus sp.]|uniref:chitobiase/beta-hexosaminidase C-terminal domain-containing protein n=1 Tax=Algoriphagus sp. TaxID=1872435 RepID=UPI0039188354
MKQNLLKINLSVVIFMMAILSTFAQSSGTYQFIETFEKLGLTGNTYRDGNFEGNNSITWNYIHVTGEQVYPINNEGLLLRRSGDNSSIKSGLISGGIRNFKVEMRKAFTSTGERQIGLFINDIKIAESDVFGNFSGESAERFSFEVENINVSGDFTLEIRHLTGGSNNRQLVIDNISWNSFGGDVPPLEPTSMPTISPNGGTFGAAQSASLTSTTAGASIYYTLDGSTPTSTSTLYTSPILIEESTTLSAIAIAEGFAPSSVASASFTINVSSPETPDPIDFVRWNFTGETGSQVSTAGSALVAGVDARAFARGAGIVATAGANSINSNGWNLGDDRFFTFGFNVAGDKLVDLTSLQIGTTSSGGGPRNFALVYSGDGFTARLAEWQHVVVGSSVQAVNQTINLSGLQNLSGNIEFRIISTSDVSANGGAISGTGTSRVTNFSPNTVPVTFKGTVKNAAGVIIPSLTTNPTSLNFGAVSQEVTAPVLTYELTATNLTSGVTVTATAPYSISKDGTSFSSSIQYSKEELADSKTVFVKLDNSNVGNFNASISNQTTGSTAASVSVTASVFDPFNISENFNSICQTNLGPLGGSWSTQSVLGDQVWACTNFGRAGNTPTATAPFGVQMNGFVGGGVGAVLNEDWLISAPYDLTGFNIPLITFWSRVAFGGPRLKLMISTDYVNGDPNTATWAELSDRFASADVWTFSGQVDLSEYLAQTVRIAFVYNSSPETGAARWTLDDFALFNSEVPAEPFFSNNIGNVDYWHFGIVPVGDVSAQTRTFSFNLSNPVADLTISAGQGFEFSKDGSSFSSTLTYAIAELTGSKSVTVRFAPTAEGAFAAPIKFESGDINVSRGYLTGATVNRNETFDVVNWNIEWFGSTRAGEGPTNVNLQLQNVKTIIEDLDADVYAFQEIASLSKFKELVNLLPGYGMAVSPAVSTPGDFAEEAQKLTYLFKLATVDTIQTRVLLKGVEPSMLVNYPSTNPNRFWASGRLPYLMDIRTNINGVQQNITLVNVHTRSNGGGESEANQRYRMRKYDVNVLKDSLDTYYSDVNLIILGDYNDDLDETVADQSAPTVGTSETSFINYMNDTENYIPITISLSYAGLRTFPSFENVIDHQIISNELKDNWIVNSERIVAPYDLIPNYNTTTSDHLPVKARYLFRCDLEQAMVISSATEVCAGVNSVDFELVGGRFDSIVGWEISTDNGTTWVAIEESADLTSITVKNLEASSLVRAIIDSNICNPIATEAVSIEIKTLPTPVVGFEKIKLFTLAGPYTYQWFKNNKLIATTSVNETKIQGAGKYTVMITDEAGCSAVSEAFSFPTKGPSNKVKVFPNPASSIVNVELKKVEGLQNVELRNASGMLIQSILSNGGIVQFNVSSLAPGVYLIYVTDRFGVPSVERLIVR